MKTITCIAMSLSFLFASTGSYAAGTVYKWRDANGQMHFSDKPPPQGNAETIKIKDTPRRTPESATADTASAETADKQKQGAANNAMSDEQKAAQAALKRQQEAQRKAIRKQNCEIARKNLKTLKSTVRVRRLDPKTGQYVRVSDKQRMQKLRESQRKIREYCR